METSWCDTIAKGSMAISRRYSGMIRFFLLAGVGLGATLGQGRLASASPFSGIAAVSAGGLSTCAVTSEGSLKCWGGDFSGQSGTMTRACAYGNSEGVSACSAVPVDAAALTSNVAAVTVGGTHACVLTTGGSVKCWGDNFVGELGDGTTTKRPLPVDVVGLTSGIASVSTADLFTCVLTIGGGVKCWGNNTVGQLGNGTTIDSHVPVDVAGLTSGLTSLSAGVDHACAVTAAGGIKCWGANTNGELGNGSTTDSSVPVDVSGLTSGATAVVAGVGFSCAVTTAGSVKCWGYNASGQLGNGNQTNSLTVVDVTALTGNAIALSAGDGHTCALTTAGHVECWGSNFSGELGIGTPSGSNIPVEVVGLGSRVVSLSSGALYDCALTVEATLKCWGANFLGGLGDGTTTNRSTPVNVSTESPWALGDVNCDGKINPIDAELVLQFVAGLRFNMPCGQNLDVNGSGSINSIDATLILQFEAALIHSFS